MRPVIPDDLVGHFFGVGSLGGNDSKTPQEYIRKITIPYAFQLPSIPEEDMIRQIGYLIEGFEENGDFILDIDLYTFREVVEEQSPLILDESHARGFHLMLNGQKYLNFKTQQTAPPTMCFSLRDSEGHKLLSKNMLYLFTQLLTKLAKGQVKHLSEYCDRIILCQDDPSLGFVLQSIENQEVHDLSPRAIMESVDIVYPRNVIPSYHCCDDWRNIFYDEQYLLWESDPKIIHIDVWSFPPTIDENQAGIMNRFLQRGGGLALGCLPNTDDVYTESVTETLRKILSKTISGFVKSGVSLDLLQERCMISTQCGLSRASHELSQKIHEESSRYPEIYKFVFDDLL